MAYNPQNPNGQATMANSAPVVLASDQASVPVTVSGVSTAAKQDTGNTSLSSIDGKLPALGQALAAASVPVVLTAAQLTTLTPLTTIPVTNTGTFAVQATPVTQVDTFMLGGVNVKEINGVTPLMGTGIMGTGSPRVTIASDNDALTVKQATGSNLHVVTDSGTITTVSTVTTVTTLSTLTNITNWGNIVDNAAFTDGTTRLMPGGYIFDEVAGTALTENDAAAARIDSKRAQVFVMEDETTRGQRATVTTRKSTLQEGPTAADAAIAASPLTVGGRASTATPSAMSTDGDVVNAWYTLNGAAVVVGDIVDDAAFGVATSRVLSAGFLADETATDSVDEGDAGAARMTLDRKLIVNPQAHTAGGATPYHLVSAASTNATSVKGSAGQVYMITASNVNAAARYLKIYNKATAPTVGSDTPVHTFIIPGNTAGAGTNIPVPTVGLKFDTGIAFALTVEATDAGSTGVAASEIVVNLAYL